MIIPGPARAWHRRDYHAGVKCFGVYCLGSHAHAASSKVHLAAAGLARRLLYIYGAHLLPSRSLQHHSHGDLAAMQPVQAGAAMLQRLAPASPRPLAQRA